MAITRRQDYSEETRIALLEADSDRHERVLEKLGAQIHATKNLEAKVNGVIQTLDRLVKDIPSIAHQAAIEALEHQAERDRELREDHRSLLSSRVQVVMVVIAFASLAVAIWVGTR